MRNRITLKKICDNYGLTPEGVDFALNQYEILLSELTNRRLSKLTYEWHFLQDVIVDTIRKDLEEDEIRGKVDDWMETLASAVKVSLKGALSEAWEKREPSAEAREALRGRSDEEEKGCIS